MIEPCELLLSEARHLVFLLVIMVKVIIYQTSVYVEIYFVFPWTSVERCLPFAPSTRKIYSKLINQKDISVEDCLSAAEDTCMQSRFEDTLPQYWVDFLNGVSGINPVTPDFELPFCTYINEGQKTQHNLLNAS